DGHVVGLDTEALIARHSAAARRLVAGRDRDLGTTRTLITGAPRHHASTLRLVTPLRHWGAASPRPVTGAPRHHASSLLVSSRRRTAVTHLKVPFVARFLLTNNVVTHY